MIISFTLIIENRLEAEARIRITKIQNYSVNGVETIFFPLEFNPLLCLKGPLALWFLQCCQ